jgi:sulfate adenylyltransferase
MNDLIAPYGGELADLFADAARVAELKEAAFSMPSWDLTLRQQADLDLLMNGAYSPLRGFMGQADYAQVVKEMRLADGTLWPVPVTLDISEALAAKAAPGQRVALRDLEGVLLAVLYIEEIWQPDRAAEAQALYGSVDPARPGVEQLLAKTHPVYVGGRVEGVEAVARHSFTALRHSPAELRRQFSKRGWVQVAAFHSVAPLHAAQCKSSARTARELGANLLLHPVVGDEEDYYYRVRCYRAILDQYPQQTTLLSLMTIPARASGLREVLWHAIVRRNYGCSHMLWESGAEQGYDLQGDALQEAVNRYGEELGIKLEPRAPLVYVEDSADFLPPEQLPAGARTLSMDQAELQRRLREGLEIPAWFSYPEVIQELRARYPSRSKQGLTLFFTGLSGAGKSTIAKAVQARLLELGGRSVTLLDGDEVRKNLSSELGFSREHRNLNIRRIGYVASEITKNGGIAICAPIAPYAEVRREVRQMISPYGGFIEIHVATTLEVCEGRDRKGLYAKARAGIIKEFTGISDPYEAPQNPELRVDTDGLTVEEAAQQVFLYLEQQGYIA